MRGRRLVSVCVLALMVTLLSPAAARSATTINTTTVQPAAPRGPGEGEVLRRSAATQPEAAAATVPPDFQDEIRWSGFTLPTALSFAPNGRVYVAEKSGLIKVFTNTLDTTPSTAADLRTVVHDFWDRGMLGMAVDPQLGTAGHNYLYVLYTYDAAPGRTAPQWNDTCLGSPNGPGATDDGCVVQGRLSRIPVDPTTGVSTGPEQVLIGPDWCQQYPSHSIGQLAFGQDGALYVSSGDGASFNFADWGQAGGMVINPSTGQPYTVANPCGDPPNYLGVPNTSPSGRGGALRSQSLRRPAGEPVLLDGTILRLDPATGNGLPDNPLASSSNANARRIVASGLRNPFRITTRPGTNEVWVGDVGWGTWEEIERIETPTAAVRNFGWPCYEGNGTQGGYAGLTQCVNLYADGANPATPPYYTYNHGANLGPGDTCRTGSSSISGMAFYAGSSYPAQYHGALFFGDHSRSCIWVMRLGAGGQPDPSTIATFVDDTDAPDPVALEADPASGDIFYADFDSGTVHRISALGQNQPPIAVAAATSPTSGPAPLTVSFDGSGSSDPDGDTITYSWDLNGDGQYGDATSATPSHTYTTPGTYAVRLRVTDTEQASSTSAPITINVGGNTPPNPVIDTPTTSLQWAVGDTVNFTGHATDAQDGTLTGSALQWTLIQHHCPSNCHTHLLGTAGTGTSGSFAAPDHEYPSYLELQLKATDSGGLSATTSVRLDPRTVALSFATNPGGLTLTLNGISQKTPFTRTVIIGSANSISAPSTQLKGKQTYVFQSWSDGGAAAHNIVAPAAATTYTARYRRA
jgi:glucose/arabinose dehydrogenase